LRVGVRGSKEGASRAWRLGCHRPGLAARCERGDFEVPNLHDCCMPGHRTANPCERGDLQESNGHASRGGGGEAGRPGQFHYDTTYNGGLIQSVGKGPSAMLPHPVAAAFIRRPGQFRDAAAHSGGWIQPVGKGPPAILPRIMAADINRFGQGPPAMLPRSIRDRIQRGGEGPFPDASANCGGRILRKGGAFSRCFPSSGRPCFPEGVPGGGSDPVIQPYKVLQTF
jgi:hypothetical protein